MASNSTSVKLTLKVASFILRLLINIIFYIFVVILIVNVSKMAYDFTYQLYGPVTVEHAPGRDIPIKIQKGESTMDVANKLEINLVIKNKYAFYLKTKLQNSVLMPGTYTINNSMTYDEILAVITDYSKSGQNEENNTDDSSDSGTQAGAADSGD